MKKFFKRGVMILGLLISIAMGFAAGVAVRQNTADEPACEASEPVDPIGEFRQERQQLRQMQLTQLNEMIHGQNTSPEMAAMAQKRQMQIMTWAEQELTLENVLALRNFQDVVATVHTDSVNVMVRSEALNARQAAVIYELVARETGIFGGNVKIIPIN